MKKLFFTAIAMVAFSSVSMASNAVDLETKLTNEVSVEQQAVEKNIKLFQNEVVENNTPISDGCHNEANGVRNQVIVNGGSIQDANRAYYSAFFSCMNRRSVELLAP